jgi:hypothetical protein
VSEFTLSLTSREARQILQRFANPLQTLMHDVLKTVAFYKVSYSGWQARLVLVRARSIGP